MSQGVVVYSTQQPHSFTISITLRNGTTTTNSTQLASQVISTCELQWKTELVNGSHAFL